MTTQNESITAQTKVKSKIKAQKLINIEGTIDVMQNTLREARMWLTDKLEKAAMNPNIRCLGSGVDRLKIEDIVVLYASATLWDEVKRCPTYVDKSWIIRPVYGGTEDDEKSDKLP